MQSLFRVKLLDDGRLEVEDCRGRIHTWSAAEAGHQMTAILRDPTLPPVEILNAGAYNLVESAARSFLPPQYQPLVKTAVSPLMQLIRQLYDAARAGPTPYQWQSPGPSAPPPGPGPQARSAHRRGHRVA